MSIPEPNIAIQPQVVLDHVSRLAQMSINLGGPIHINMPFRAPLEPQNQITKEWQQYRERALDIVRQRAMREPSHTITLESFEDVLSRLKGKKKPLLLVGQLDPKWELSDQWQVLTKLRIPTYFDPTSSMRGLSGLGSIESSSFLHFVEQYKPDLIIHLGRRLLSQKMDRYLDSFSGTYVVVTHNTEWQDPSHSCDFHFSGSEKNFAKALLELNPGDSIPRYPNDDVRGGNSNLVEVETVMRDIWSNLPARSSLFLGNSSSIRFFDQYCHDLKDSPIPTFTNRGVSGIEGHLATPLGIADGTQEPVVAIIGDVSFLYDMNALVQISQTKTPMTIIVFNDNGGGIFKRLPIGAFSSVVDPYLVAPHQIELHQLQSAFPKLNFLKVRTVEEWQRALVQGTKFDRHTIIECQLDEGMASENNM